MKFKKGDKVVYTTTVGSNYTGKASAINPFVIGQVYTVHRDSRRIHDSYIDLEGIQVGEFECCFELAKEKAEVCELIRKANEGYQAVYQLRTKYFSEVDFSFIGGPFKPEKKDVDYIPSKFRLKPKPTFITFTVGKDWKVNLDKNLLTIGCQTFNADEFKRAVKQSETSELADTLKGEYLTSGRYGVKWGQHQLTWAEVDQIMEALKTAGI